MSWQEEPQREELIKKLQQVIRASGGNFSVKSRTEDDGVAIELKFKRNPGGDAKPLQDLAAILIDDGR